MRDAAVTGMLYQNWCARSGSMAQNEAVSCHTDPTSAINSAAIDLNLSGLTLTAESEYAVVQFLKNNGTSTAASADSTSLSHLIPPLLEATEQERTYVEDEFQAQVCLGWIHWVVGEPTLTVARLPKDIDHDFAELDGTGKQSAGWTRVCAVKAAYLKGAAHLKLGSDSDALFAFDTGMPILSLEGSNLGHELRIWTELLLSNACLLYSKTLAFRRTRAFETETLSAFRSWAKFWGVQSGSDPVPGGSGIQSTIPRRYVWRKYYLTLSNILQKGQPYPTSSLITAYVDDSAKIRQREELKNVQTAYEGLLLMEVQFPKAEEQSQEIEEWVETVAENWRVLCGSTWQEYDLSAEREARSRHVLDILYRAATKTFHSTSILRYLFTVHLAVADFDLAFKAFDTYLDLIKKGKAREEKTGEAEPALDDDETVLMTAAECIRALCRYGSRPGAEKARELGRYVEGWLKKHTRGDAGSHRINGNGRDGLEKSSSNRISTVSDYIISKAWLSVGISQAQWARFTYDTAARSDIQLHAVDCLRKALSPKLKNTNDVEALFALGILLSERRELDAAIEVVKSALLPSSSSTDSASRDSGPYSGEFARERSLIPMWHLLALLLSARQEFTTAARSCEGAFEQFRDPTNLFGHSLSDGAYRSDHLNEKSRKASLGVVDIMEDFEKETILEVKITQLALVEVLEGPEVAVNASDELLSLYARLFGDPDKTVSSISPKTANEPPPKSSAGTIRTLGGSLFGRTRSNRRHSKTTTISEKIEGAVASTRPQTSATHAPSIHVTNEAGSPARQRIPTHIRERSTHRQEKLHKPRNRSSSTGKAGHQRSATGVSTTETSNHSSAYFTPPPNTLQQQEQQIDRESSMVGVAISSEEPHFDGNPKSNTLPPDSQNMQQTELPLRSNGERRQDSRLPRPFVRNPATHFPKSHERRRRLGTLVRLWLLVAGFYRRATMLEDAIGALEEAKKLVDALETDVSQDQSGEVSVQNPGWGGGKSVEELWGDVWAEVSTTDAGTKIQFADLTLQARPIIACQGFAADCPGGL